MRITSAITFVLIGILALAVGCSKEARLEKALAKAERSYADRDFEVAELAYLKVLQMDSANALALKKLGLLLFEQGRFLMAFQFLSDAVKYDPEDTDLRLALGITQIQFGQFESARGQALEVLSSQPTNDRAFLLLAESTRNTNQIAETFARLEQLQEVAADRPGYHLAVGSLYLRGRNIERARAEIQKAVELDPDSPDTQAALGNLFLVQGNVGDADIHLRRAADLEGVRSFRKLGYAQFKLRMGQTEEGKVLLAQILEQTPDFVPAWVLLAEQGLTEKDYDQCRKLANEILKRDPGNFDAKLLQGRLDLADGNADEALATFEYLHNLFPDTPGLHYYIGLVRAQKGDLGRALASLSRAIELSPAFGDAVLLKAELCLREGDPVPAARALEDYIAGNGASERMLPVLIEAYRRLGRVEDALNVCNDWMDRAPGNPEPPLLAGRVLRDKRMDALAREAFERALRITPDNVVVLEELVNMDLAAGDYESATQRAQAMLRANPQSPAALVLLAKVHDAQRRYSEAETCLQEAIKLAPDASTAYFVLAVVQNHAGQPTQAVETLRKFLEMEPKSVLGLLQLAAVQEKLAQHSEAGKTYQQLLEIDPENGVALNNLACLYAGQLNDLEQAHALAQRARNALPADPAIMDTLGWILYKQGKYGSASSLLRDAARLSPRSAEVHFHLGMNYYKLGQESEAEAAFSKAGELSRSFDGSEEMEECLLVLAVDPLNADPQARKTLEHRLEKNPNDAVALMRLGAILNRDGDFARAIESYKTAVQSVPSSLPAHLELAEIHLDSMKDPQKALDYARTARGLAPEDAQVAYALGKLAYRAGDHSWAVSLLRECSGRLQTDAMVFRDLGLAELSIGEIAKATNALQRAFDMAPLAGSAADTQQLLALCSLILDPAGLEQSYEWVNKLVSESPGYFPATFIVGLIQEQRGDLSAASQTYQKVLQPGRFPHFAPAQKRLALIAIMELEPGSDGALEMARKARQQFPQDKEVMAMLGKVAFHHQDFETVTRVLSDPALAGQLTAESYFYLGMAHFEKKQKQDCENALRRALDLGLEPAQDARARAALTALE